MCEMCNDVLWICTRRHRTFVLTKSGHVSFFFSTCYDVIREIKSKIRRGHHKHANWLRVTFIWWWWHISVRTEGMKHSSADFKPKPRCSGWRTTRDFQTPNTIQPSFRRSSFRSSTNLRSIIISILQSSIPEVCPSQSQPVTFNYTDIS